MKRRIALAVELSFVLLLVNPIYGQGVLGPSQSDTHRMAAQAYNNAAAKCQNPAGAACLRQYANYENCQAGSGSCGAPPSCSTACTGSGATSSTLLPSFGTGLPTNPKAEAVGNLVGLGMSLLLSRHRDSDAEKQEQPDPAAVQAARAEADRQRINAEAADLLQESNSLMASLNLPGSAPAAPNAASELDSLLDNGQPSNASTAAISNLLDDGTTPTAAPSDPTATVAGLLGDSSDSKDSSSAPSAVTNNAPAASPVTSALQPVMPASLTPQDPQINSALQQSSDQPDPNETGSLAQMFQSAKQEVKDGLDNLVSSGKTLMSDITNDPVIQWATSDAGSLTTMPLPATGDSPETTTDKVFGQSVVGFGDLIKGWAKSPTSVLAFPKALYSYGTKMVNQIGADLGLANDTIFGTGQGFGESRTGSN